jgi:hypothetical protein
VLCDVLYAVLCALLYAAVPVDVLELDGFESEDELDGLESEEADDFDDAGELLDEEPRLSLR